MTDHFNKDECIENLKTVLGMDNLDELPHYDTINDFLSELEPKELESIRTYMIKELLKKRCLEDYRLRGKYWCIIFDGTGLLKFNERHCEHCLKRVYNKGTEQETTVYMHHVLEAKLLVSDMVLSIGTEFIENESEDVTKQDCEMIYTAGVLTKEQTLETLKVKKLYNQLVITTEHGLSYLKFSGTLPKEEL